MDVKIVIEGEEVQLDFKRSMPNGNYAEFGEPKSYADMGPGRSPLIVTAYIRPDWKPSMGTGKLSKGKVVVTGSSPDQDTREAEGEQ